MAPLTDDDVVQTAAAFGFTIAASELPEYKQMLERSKAILEDIANTEDYQPQPDLTLTPRTNVYFPESAENPLRGWAWKCRCQHAKPSSTLLQDKTVCLKDNICLAGVPCLLGTDTFTGWVPKTDATVVTRILSHGGIIAGKAVCENLSRGAVSCTAATGPVDNPYAKGYSAGGSSSGTGALVGSGAVDMGLGCDQGGSVRIPAALCGLYGFKATTGLVPYTGIASNDASVDYVGPMTRTCTDCAVLLEAIAGVDGLDDRQIAGTPFLGSAQLRYRDALSIHADAAAQQGLRGVRIGILQEGVDTPLTDPNVKAKFLAAVAGFAKLGATVTEVSVPMHRHGRGIYTIMSKMGNHMGMLGRATGRRQVMLTDLLEKKNLPYTQSVIEKMNMVSKEGLMTAEYGWTHFPLAYPKAVNLTRKLKDEYDAALDTVDFLVMPTTVTPSNPVPGPDATPAEHIAASAGKLENTSPFNGTGHPALAMPIGFVPSQSEPGIKLPASMQIVGKFWDEARILQVAYAWETAYDWKSF
ncbi:Amidase [Niveomyces insectorum RCEF 264]|uniref:Amidase n=1 Tax=Niveomyces insectorum RCEF 264 TaxID=1081102 RepID=A0A167Q7Y4_9HYPO|nr:Amidase [Niveomyces insectorum RCEF 264]